MATQPTLAELTTLRVGGPAARYLEVTSQAELVDVVRAADAAGEPVLLVSGGSNLLVDDAPFEGVVVRVATRGVHVESADSCGGVMLRVEAGEPWDGVVSKSVERGWVGIEALAGIPGSAGATPVQNVGAYGQEVAQTLASLRAWDRVDGRVRTFAAAECGFGYRTSMFKRTAVRGSPRFVVLDVLLQLPQGELSAPVAYGELARALDVEVGERVPLRDVRQAVLKLRRSKGMVLDPADHDTWSAGSFFTNPLLNKGFADAIGGSVPRWAQPDGRVKVSAAWLIERAGFGRGFGLPGPAALSTKHTLALTNRGTATAADLLALARQVRDGVESAFGVRLLNEPLLVGCEL